MTRLGMKKTRRHKGKKRAFFRSHSRSEANQAVSSDRTLKSKKTRVMVSQGMVAMAISKFRQGKGDK